MLTPPCLLPQQHKNSIPCDCVLGWGISHGRTSIGMNLSLIQKQFYLTLKDTLNFLGNNAIWAGGWVHALQAFVSVYLMQIY